MIGEPEGEREKGQKGQRPQKAPMIIRIFRAFKRYKNRRRRESIHQTNERMMARWTRHVGLFTGALVVVSIVTATIFWRQLTVMQGQLDEMKAEQRAWLSINLVELTDFSQSDKTVTAALRFTFKNVGHLPAQHVFVFVSGITYPGPPSAPINPIELRRKQCEIVRKDHRFLTGGQTVFPEQISVPEQHGFDIMTNNPKVATGSLDLILPIIYGCVTYKADSGDVSHQTGFIYDLGLRFPDGGIRAIPLRKRFDKKDLVLSIGPFGGFDAD